MITHPKYCVKLAPFWTGILPTSMLLWSAQALLEQMLGVEKKKRIKNSWRCKPPFGVEQLLPLVFVVRISDLLAVGPPLNVVNVMTSVGFECETLLFRESCCISGLNGYRLWKRKILINRSRSLSCDDNV